MKTKQILILFLGIALCQQKLTAQETHLDSNSSANSAENAAPQSESPGPVNEIMKQYLQPGSAMAAKDKKTPSPDQASILFHLFPTGPYGESVNDFKIFDPALTYASGPKCSEISPLEFSVLWKRNPQGVLEISKVGLHLGASHSRKVSKEKVSLPNPIYGSLVPYALEAGKISYHFSPDYKQLVEDERIRVEADIEEKLDGSRDLGFLVNGKRVVPRINQSAVLAVQGRSGQRASAVLMPFSTHFAQRSEGLFDTMQWGLHSPTGTAIHGADAEHLGNRSPSNVGSAGCARVQNSMAATLHKEISELLFRSGARIGRNGNFFIEEDDIREDNKLKGQVLSETSQNLENLKALLAVRSQVAIESFNPSSTRSLYTYYYRSYEAAQSKTLEANDQIETIQKGVNQAQSSVARLQNRGGLFRNKRKDAEELAIAQNNLRVYLEHAEKAKQNAEVLVKEVDVLYRKLKSLKSGYDNATPLHSPSPEVRALYENPQYLKQLKQKIADALEEQYRNLNGGKISQGCKEFVDSYRQAAQQQ